MRLKDVASVNVRSLDESTKDEYTFKYIDISSVSFEDGISLGEDIIFANAPSRARRIVQKGDVLISTVRTYLRAIADIDWDAENVIASTGFAVFSPNDKINPRFLAYAAKSTEVINQICSNSKGVSYPAIQASLLSSVTIPYYNIAEQEAIAAYLDRECEKIGRRIELLERKADAYRRLRRSIINRAVTNRSRASLRIKDIFDIVGGNGFKEQLQGRKTGDYPFVKTSDINFCGSIITSAANYITEDDIISHNYNIIPANSIICSKIGAALKLNHRKLTTSKIIIDNNLQALIPKVGFNPKFCYYILLLLDMSMFDNLGAIPCVNNKLLRNHHLSVPSLDEQQEIAAYLDDKCGKIDAIIEKIGTQIERLKELKRSLINEVVTGKRAINCLKP